MSLPLFLGMSSNDISNLLTTFPIAYHVYGDGKVVAQADTACNSLIFLVRGKMRVSTTADDHGYTIEELFEAPNVVQPERLFGISPRYTRTFTTAGQCAVMCIAKNDVVKLSATYDIFRINLLNLFSTQAQRLARIPCQRQQAGTHNPFHFQPLSATHRPQDGKNHEVALGTHAQRQSACRRRRATTDGSRRTDNVETGDDRGGSIGKIVFQPTRLTCNTTTQKRNKNDVKATQRQDKYNFS